MMRARSKSVLWLPLGLMVACGAQDTGDTGLDPGDYEGIDEAGGELANLSGQCVFVTATGVMTLTLASADVAMLNKSAAGLVLTNGFTCVSASPVVTATSTNVKRIDIIGAAGAETVILDYLGGTFAMGTATSAGVTIDLAGGADAVKIRGSKAADAYVFGTTGIAINADANKDVTVTNVEAFTISLSDGADTFSAAGNVATGAAAFATAVTVYGGAGNDIIRGGDGDDTYHGGDGNDTFTTGTLDDGSDIINGSDGVTVDVDTLDYSTRTVAVIVTLDGAALDGESGELDNAAVDIEVVKGGTAGDTLTGGVGSQTLSGGAGNDTLDGALGDDILNGDAGDDTFNEGAATNGADVFNGGTGIDTVNYGSRVAAVTVTMDTTADDGLTGTEADKVMVDVENATTGTGIDTLTGSTVANVLNGGDGVDTITGGDGADTLVGGLGADILNGGLGDDSFNEEAVTNGADTMTGGAGIDTVNYGARVAALTVVMDGATGSGIGGATEGDLIGLDVENLIGGTAADSLTGNVSDNQIEGGTGAVIDTIFGLAGEDVIDGGAGVDVIDCGTGDADINLDLAAQGTNCEL